MYAALSVTASEMESFSESLRSSMKACFRFLSADSCIWLLLSHVLIRSTLDFIGPSRTNHVFHVPAIALLVLFSISAISVPAHALPSSANAAYVVDPGHSGCEGFGGTAALGYADPIFDGCSVFVNAVTGSVPA